MRKNHNDYAKSRDSLVITLRFDNDVQTAAQCPILATIQGKCADDHYQDEAADKRANCREH